MTFCCGFATFLEPTSVFPVCKQTYVHEPAKQSPSEPGTMATLSCADAVMDGKRNPGVLFLLFYLPVFLPSSWGF